MSSSAAAGLSLRGASLLSQKYSELSWVVVRLRYLGVLDANWTTQSSR